MMETPITEKDAVQIENHDNTIDLRFLLTCFNFTANNNYIIMFSLMKIKDLISKKCIHTNIIFCTNFLF